MNTCNISTYTPILIHLQYHNWTYSRSSSFCFSFSPLPCLTCLHLEETASSLSFSTSLINSLNYVCQLFFFFFLTVVNPNTCTYMHIANQNRTRHNTTANRNRQRDTLEEVQSFIGDGGGGK